MLPAIIIVAAMVPAATREFDENLIMEMKTFGENGGESTMEILFYFILFFWVWDFTRDQLQMWPTVKL